MTTSAKKICANQRNATASTGPRTTAGKKRAAQNAFRHGLSLPATVFLPTQPLFERLYHALRLDIDVSSPPAGNFFRPRQTELSALEQGLIGNDQHADPSAQLAAVMLDLSRLRIARHKAATRFLEAPEDVTTLDEFCTLLRYGRRLNAQLRRIRRKNK